MDLTFKQIAERLQIAVGTAHRIFKRFMDTGDVSATVQKGVPRHSLRKLDQYHELYILCMISENPGLYLAEICQQIQNSTNVSVSGSTVCRLLHRNGYSRKKIVQVAKQRRLEYRGAFMAEVLQYRKDMFVFVDETGSNRRDHARKFGYAIQGEAPVYQRSLVRGRRVSAIAAITTDGVLSYEMTQDSVNGDKFLDYVRGSLIPNMNPFDGISGKSIVIMDNCSVHHTQEVHDELQNAGVLVIFLPPYSPDYMPIELCFSYIKYYLKRHDDLLQTISDPTPIISSAFQSVTSHQCTNWINHCGYE